MPGYHFYFLMFLELQSDFYFVVINMQRGKLDVTAYLAILNESSRYFHMLKEKLVIKFSICCKERIHRIDDSLND